MPHATHRYPTGWIDRRITYDGSVATARPILPQDAPLEATLIKGLLPELRYARLLVGGGRLTDEMLAAHTQIDYVDHMALVVSVAHPNGIGEDLIADGRFAVKGGVVEFVILMADAWQSEGVRRRLFATLVRATWMSDAREVSDKVLFINRRMISLARDVGFRVTNVPGNAIICTVHLPLMQTEMVVTPFAFA